jgi:hypothetical protein
MFTVTRTLAETNIFAEKEPNGEPREAWSRRNPIVQVADALSAWVASAYWMRFTPGNRAIKNIPARNNTPNTPPS